MAGSSSAKIDGAGFSGGSINAPAPDQATLYIALAVGALVLFLLMKK